MPEMDDRKFNREYLDTISSWGAVPIDGSEVSLKHGGPLLDDDCICSPGFSDTRNHFTIVEVLGKPAENTANRDKYVESIVDLARKSDMQFMYVLMRPSEKASKHREFYQNLGFCTYNVCMRGVSAMIIDLHPENRISKF